MLTDKHIKQFAFFYLACFLLSYCWHFYNGLLFSEIQPVYFVNKLDFTRNILMLTGLQQRLLDNSWWCVCFDFFYLAFPVVLTIAIIKNDKSKSTLAFCTSAFSLLYAIFFTGISYTSPEGAIGWALIPLIFSASTIKGFYYYLHSVRFIFILVMISAGIWKIIAGGLFNIEEMAGIVLKQHNAFLVSNADNWYTQFIYWLVLHKVIAYIFYLLGAIAELIYVIGLFTRRFDRLLIIVFCLFFIFDFFLMKINYFSWTVFMGCFYFSSFSLSYSSANKYANKRK